MCLVPGPTHIKGILHLPKYRLVSLQMVRKVTESSPEGKGLLASQGRRGERDTPKHASFLIPGSSCSSKEQGSFTKSVIIKHPGQSLSLGQ